MAMAENLDDGEFWLPSQFLSDDETFESSKYKNNVNNVVSVEETLFPSEIGYGGLFGLSSYLSSPFGGSSETESDEDEQQHQLAEFTRLTSRSNLHSHFNNTKKSTGNLFSGSPQSTLCGFGSGCGMCCKGSNQGSPNSVCNKMHSARTTWDLLHAAAGEVERMRLNQQETSYPFHNRKPFVGSFLTQQSLSHQQLQIAQYDMMRKQQMCKVQQQQNNGSASLWGVYQQRQSKKNPMVVPNRGGRNNNMPLDLSSNAWPSLQNAKQIKNQHQQQQFRSNSNGMRAVFLGGGRRECAGTGVFLPRPATESRKKPACSTALVPDRVVQALNRKMEDMVGCQQQQHLHRFNASSNMEKAVAAGPRHMNNYTISQQKKNLRPQPTMNHEISLLPQEWTY
ncbi:hypothetical protein Lal_00041839 [Lupinus albus]|uniref:Uncharacterized protein n=1 Tax=Lupinus albus TaxID=3870 RepID=A0A6A5PFC7_LUPAL|nr:hypothetical protein Lalb_Chr03g0042761 [Lupinus albus]KAF1895559.1 hypothetical protein Lal_00041839 [Lupinus albus]